MKKTLSLLSALALLLTLAGCALAPGRPAAPLPTDAPAAESPAPLPPAPSPTPAPEPKLADAAAGQSFAAVLTACFGAWPEGARPDDANFLMEATGWYAAWRWRCDGISLLSADEALAFQHALGSTGELVLDPEYEEYGILRRVTAADGSESLDFAQHKALLEATLGVTLALRTEQTGDGELEAVVSRHFDNGASYERVYSLRFVPNPGDLRFPWKLSQLRCPPDGPEMDPAFDFDWALLNEQNRVTLLTKQNAAVRLAYSHDPERVTWLFDRGGDLCLLNVTQGLIYGEYRGAYFEYGRDEDGVLRARVSGFDGHAGSAEANDTLLTDLFASAVTMEAAGTDGDDLRIRALTEYGYRQEFLINRGTLALQREDYYFDGDEPASSVLISYPAERPDFAFLDAWDEPLRRVTVVWEDFSDGRQNVHEQVYTLPGTWEYLPWEGRFGDYTIYMNAGYTRPYFYPGDGIDYTLYLTTAKG